MGRSYFIHGSNSTGVCHDLSSRHGKKQRMLEVLPGSHRKIHGLHENEKAHTEGVSRVENPEDPLYQSIEGEREVSVNFGDVVIGDARLIHGAYPNQSDQERTLITLWYHPDYSKLPDPIQTRIHEIFVRKGGYRS